MAFSWAEFGATTLVQGIKGIVSYSQAERDRNMRRGIYQAEVKRRDREMKLAKDKMSLDRQLRGSEESRSSSYQDQLSATPWRPY